MIPSKQNSKARPGFALIISMTLMAFLLLLIVGLTALTTLETQSAIHTRNNTQARQNALTALGIAIGELQKYAGPDQRVTARADLQNDAAASPLWTGVYGNSIAANYDDDPVQIATDLTNPAKVDSKGSSAKLLSWLVSGNESIGFSPSDDVGSSGEIINPPADSSITFKPVGTIANLNVNTTAKSTDLTIQNASGGSLPARLMVGPGSAGDASVTNASLQDYVAVPAVDMEGAGGGVSGRYAWWVGDEGVKARADLPLVTEDDDKLNAFVNATRTAVELMATGPGSEATLDGDRIDNAYNPLASNLELVDERNELTLTSPQPDNLKGYLKNRFHDVTVHSQSVLSDTYAGGLKRDLSILLDENYAVPDDDPTADTNRMWAFDPTVDKGYHGTKDGWQSPPGYNIPTWGHLRSYAQTRIPTTGADAMKMSPILPMNDKEEHDGVDFPDHVGLGPVITYFSIGFSMQPGAPPAEGVPLNIQLYPLVIIWNPYNFTIKAPPMDPDGGNYEVGFYPTYAVRFQLQVDDPVTNEWRRLAIFDFQNSMDGNWANREYIRFRLNCPDIPPGQSLIFSLPIDSSGDTYTQYNVLENIEPERSSYVALPITYTAQDYKEGVEPANKNRINQPITIAAGEENTSYRLKAHYQNNDTTNVGSSFSQNGKGEAYIYLGQPVSSSVNLQGPNQHIGHNPSYWPRRWYNAQQRAEWNGIEVAAGNVLQLTNQLTYSPDDSDPSFVFLAQAFFSGLGSNGEDYSNLHMFSTRWIAQGNMRAIRTGRTRRDPRFNPLFFATAGSPGGGTEWDRFKIDKGANSNRTSAGQTHDWVNGAPEDAILFEFPYEDQPLFSIGQLQHANLSLVGSYPSYPIGNSLADFRLPYDGTPGGELVRTDVAKGAKEQDLTYEQTAYYDISYLLNRTLWDQYYFSTIPTTGDIPDELPNPRYDRHNSEFAEVDLQNPDKNAGGIMLKGGFNINSSSEQAWRAVLAGTNQLAFDPQTSDSSNTPLQAAFPRFTKPISDNNPNDAWGGSYRTLDEEQVAQLAHNIVTEIKNRGPFISVSDFVNRRLVDNPDTNTDSSSTQGSAYVHEHYSGALQAAINRTIDSSEKSHFPANDIQDDFWNGDFVTDLFTEGQFGKNQYEKGMVFGADQAGKPYSNRSSHAPNFLTQGDILSTIGASLTARSDTFVIRAYGEVINPLNSNDVKAQAWCEAVVQRYPEYIDESSNNPEEKAADDTLNDNFGRKFKIIDFRWLSVDEV